jgi:hypothetical protein
MLLTQSDAGTWRFSLSSATNGAALHVEGGVLCSILGTATNVNRS